MDLEKRFVDDIKKEIDAVLAVIHEDDFEFALVKDGEIDRIGGLTSDLIVTILENFMGKE